jgi:hypothetical protein
LNRHSRAQAGQNSEKAQYECTDVRGKPRRDVSAI